MRVEAASELKPLLSTLKPLRGLHKSSQGFDP